MIQRATAQIADSTRIACAHCGADCPDPPSRDDELAFCCTGCRSVFRILHEAGLDRFYALEKHPGVRIGEIPPPDRYGFLDAGALREQLADYADERVTRVTLRIPSMHCLACVWLLENLFRLDSAIGASRVNFPRKELTVSFDHARLPFSRLAQLLTSLGYEPDINLGAVRAREAHKAPSQRGLWLRIGVAGFAFGNIMLLSFPSYLGLREGEVFRPFFGWLSFGLALPVLLFSASEFWLGAWRGIRRRLLTIDFPLSLGLAALFLQSTSDVATGSSEGYFDSFAGLVFFLLCGRWFQQKSFDWLSFDRDYQSYFPLSVLRIENGVARPIPLTELRVGDRIRVRNGEIVPADARLVDGPARLDYSFVTGESAPVARAVGDHIYAGARQVGPTIELETVKETSRSYLASLWDHEAFRKSRDSSLHNMTNRAGRWFTVAVLLFAAGAGVWWWARDPASAPRVFASILVVACPCALALSAPFALGAAVRLLARHRVFIKNTDTIENLARSNTVVLDKTGTLTHARPTARFEGDPLSDPELRAARAAAAHSTHPISRAIAADFQHLPAVNNFVEAEGRGISATVDGSAIVIGSADWLVEHDVAPAGVIPTGAAGLAVNGVYRGFFMIEAVPRTDIPKLAAAVARDRELMLLSGDRDAERAQYAAWLGPQAEMRFNQTPADKLEAIRERQACGRRVVMVGDGLNDAGALKQADVGIAVTERASTFSPSSDVILEADQIGKLPNLLSFARRAVRVVLASFLISLCYNALGLSFAASGRLTPMISAILMPMSSFTVISFALLGTRWAAARSGWNTNREDAR